MTKENKKVKEFKDNDQKKANKDIFLDYMPYIIIIVMVIILRSFIATPVRVNGPSMETTLKSGETMILNKLGMKVKGLNRFDIVVIKIEDNYLIKRIIGLPGESIMYEESKLYINGRNIEDKFSKTVTEDFEEVKLENDEYFLMGDNRFESQDSRAFGPIKKSQIIGKTNLILFPFKRMGKVK